MSYKRDIITSELSFRFIFRSTKEQKTIHSFVGLPYAEPPVGKLRFSLPQPYAGNWGEKEFDASKYTDCRQSFDFGGSISFSGIVEIGVSLFKLTEKDLSLIHI